MGRDLSKVPDFRAKIAVANILISAPADNGLEHDRTNVVYAPRHDSAHHHAEWDVKRRQNDACRRTAAAAPRLFLLLRLRSARRRRIPTDRTQSAFEGTRGLLCRVS